MTQAFNLSQFANKLNSSGQTDNTGLQNSSVTVNTSTGLSGGGSIALGSSVTLTNTGVTSVTAGSGISVSASTGGVTISASGGGVTSYNGQTGAISNNTFNAIGSYTAATRGGFGDVSAGSTISGSSLRVRNTPYVDPFGPINETYTGSYFGQTGTWRAMSTSGSNGDPSGYNTASNLWVRIS